MKEIDLGKMGAQKATNPKVKDFAQRIADDHTKANNELESIAKQKGVTLPMAPSHEKGGEHAMTSRLSKMSGAAFDKAFVDDMVTDHQKAITRFENESKSGTDTELKDFATKTLPTLRSHLDTAQMLQREQK